MRKGVGTGFIRRDGACTAAEMTQDFSLGKPYTPLKKGVCKCLERKTGMNVKRPSSGLSVPAENEKFSVKVFFSY